MWFARRNIPGTTMLRPLAIAGLCLMSTACIAVGSREPIFSSADAGNAPQPRPGLWASPDPDCNFDPTAPVDGWPSCANGTVVRAHVLGPPHDPSSMMDYVVTAGDPRILQMPWPRSDKTGDKKGAPKFSYIGLKPTKFDTDGRFTEAKVWITLCGEQVPPPRDMDAEQKKAAPPEGFKPLDGLDWHKGDDFCIAESKDAVRAAAKASEGWTTDQPSVQWIRDAEN
jgi:hypothetical protein